MELEPLDARIVTAMVRGVHTPIHARAGELELSANSYYQRVRETINNVRRGEMKFGCREVGVTVRNTVRNIFSGRSGFIWRGGLASVSRYLTRLLPQGLLEYAANRNRGLSEVVRCRGSANSRSWNFGILSVLFRR